MRYLLIILLSLLSLVGYSQLPTGFPTQANTGWTQWGYQQSTLGTIIATRDTLWQPRYCGTMVLWPHAGVDTAYWMWDCVHWKKLSSAGDIIAPIWGNITGTLSNQTDLQNALNLKFNISDTTNKWVQDVLVRNDSLFKFKNGAETFLETVVSTIIANNGLSKTLDSVQLGQTVGAVGSPAALHNDREIPLNGYRIGLSGTGSFGVGTATPSFSYRMTVQASGSTAGINVSSATATGINVSSTNTGIVAFSSTGSAINATSSAGAGTYAIIGTGGIGGAGGKFGTAVSGGDANTTILELERNTTGPGSSNGAGFNILFKNPISIGSTSESGRITNYFSTFTSGAQTSAFGFHLVDNAVSARKALLAGSGQWTWDGYPALAAQVDTTTYKPVAIDGSGNVVKMVGWAGSGGGGGGATLNNIGTGYRWAATPAGDIKTHNPGYGLLDDSTTVANTITTKIDTNVIDGRYMKVYNVVSRYGATPDGKERYDGAMTNGSPTLTCVSCVFTANDVGKSIRVEGAITNGDLVTTISGFTSSSVVTLGANATRTVSGDTLVYGTDNTTAFRNAITDAYTNGDGRVLIPAAQGGGFYILAGPLITSYDGTNPNAQIPWPVADLGSSSFNNRKRVIIEGVVSNTDVPSTLFGDTVTAKYGSVLYSIINGSGGIPSVFGTKAPSSGFGFINYNEIVFKNLTILVPRNRYDGGPSIGGINGLYSSTTQIENVSVGIGGSINKQPKPTHDVAGIVIGKKDSEIYSYVKNSSTYGFKYGFIYNEDVSVDHCIAHASIFGHTITSANYPVVAGLLDGHWCQNTVYIPNHNLFGLFPLSPGVSQFSIQYLAAEIFDGSSLGAPAWLDYVHVVSDSGIRGRGTISAYSIGQAEVGLNNSKFNKFGGDSIFARQVGSQVNPNPYSWTNQLKANNIFMFGGHQNGGASSYFYNWSPFSDASILRASPISGNTSQGLYLSPTGTGGSSVSPIQSWINLFNTPFWSGENSTNSNYEVLQFAATGSEYTMRSIIAGTGTVRPINIYTGGNTGQLYLSASNKVFVGKTTDATTGILQVESAGADIASFTSSAASNASVYFGAASGRNINYVFRNGASNVWYLQNNATADNFKLFNSDGNGNQEKLNISQSGAITFNNAFTFPTTDGSASQVLQTNGSGVVTWATVSGATTLYSGDGTLAAERNVSSGGFTVRFRGTNNSDTIMSIINDGTSSIGLFSIGSLFGIDAQSTNVGLRAFGTSIGLLSTGDNSYGATIKSNSIAGLLVQSVPATTNTVQEVMRIERGVNGSPGANGIGGSITFYNKRTDNASDLSHSMESEFTDAVAATLTSKLSIKGKNSGTTTTFLEIGGNGSIRFNKYGVGTFTGTQTYDIQSDASGNLIEAQVINASATLDFASTGAGTSTDLTITATGASVGDIVLLGIPNASVPATGSFMAWVSATNTVTVRYINNDPLAAQDPASGSFKVRVPK